MKKVEITVKDINVSLFKQSKEDYISLTDIARYKNKEFPADVVKNWMRSKNTLEFLGLWERINNCDFKLVEFDQFKKEAGYHHFVLSPKKWITKANAIGLISKSGRYGGTYAHKDIAFEFASWISAEFKLYLIKEFQRLKAKENENNQWSAKRMLSKINYKIHTDAIDKYLIPQSLSKLQINTVYASEADILNIALFGMTAKQWRNKNPNKSGNIRDYADVRQLICLANLESFNSELIKQNLKQCERLKTLNRIAISQMKSLLGSSSIGKLMA